MGALVPLVLVFIFVLSTSYSLNYKREEFLAYTYITKMSWTVIVRT